VGLGSSVAEFGVVGTGTAGAEAVEAALPTALTTLAAGLGALLLIVAALVLRPRLLRLLTARRSIVPTRHPTGDRAAAGGRGGRRLLSRPDRWPNAERRGIRGPHGPGAEREASVRRHRLGGVERPATGDSGFDRHGDCVAAVPSAIVSFPSA
jgi:hypothetical protein